MLQIISQSESEKKSQHHTNKTQHTKCDSCGLCARKRYDIVCGAIALWCCVLLRTAACPLHCTHRSARPMPHCVDAHYCARVRVRVVLLPPSVSALCFCLRSPTPTPLPRHCHCHFAFAIAAVVSPQCSAARVRVIPLRSAPTGRHRVVRRVGMTTVSCLVSADCALNRTDPFPFRSELCPFAARNPPPLLLAERARRRVPPLHVTPRRQRVRHSNAFARV